MDPSPFLWGLLSLSLCLWCASGSQLVPGVSSVPPTLPDLPNCFALTRVSGGTRSAASKRIAGLLRRTDENAKSFNSSGDFAVSKPLVLALGRPFERLSLRRLLGCPGLLGTKEEQHEIADSEESSSRVEEWWGQGWRSLCNGAGFGLDLLPSGAHLLTVELPSAGQPYKPSGGTLSLDKADRKTQQADGAEDAGHRISPSSREKGMGALETVQPYSAVAPCATEATLLAAMAVPLVESADVLLLPLMHQNVTWQGQVSVRPTTRPTCELLYLETSKEAVQDEKALAEDDTANTLSINSEGAIQSLHRDTPVDCCRVQLPEDVMQLLRAVKHLVPAHGKQEATGNTLPLPRSDQNNDPQEESVHPVRLRRLPHIIILLQGLVPLELEEAVRAEVRDLVGDTKAQVSVVSVKLPDGEVEAREKLQRLVEQTPQRRLPVSQIADSLAAFFTGPSDFGPPSSVEFPSRAIASRACAGAARHALANASKCLRRIQEMPAEGPVFQFFGPTAQRVLTEALRYYDSKTWRFQLSPERRVLRLELQRSLELKLRRLYVREALRIEHDSKLRLRASLVGAMQKDARRFGSVSHDILTDVRHSSEPLRHDRDETPATVIVLRMQAIKAVDRQLMGLLPPAATDTTRVVKDSSLGQAQEASNPLGTSGTSEALAESAITSRDLWLCHRLSTTFSELHVLFLQRIARSFTNLVMELSQSRLAALLRQHQNRRWLGVSLRPALSLTTLLRTRGDGNLQGYSRYNAGAFNILFGFTNDGEGLKQGQQAAFLIQPKLHLDLEVG